MKKNIINDAITFNNKGKMYATSFFLQQVQAKAVH